MISRFIVVREGEGWAVGHHVATCDEVPVYSLIDERFEVITDATAWVERRGMELAE